MSRNPGHSFSGSCAWRAVLVAVFLHAQHQQNDHNRCARSSGTRRLSASAGKFGPESFAFRVARFGTCVGCSGLHKTSAGGWSRTTRRRTIMTTWRKKRSSGVSYSSPPRRQPATKGSPDARTPLHEEPCTDPPNHSHERVKGWSGDELGVRRRFGVSHALSPCVVIGAA